MGRSYDFFVYHLLTLNSLLQTSPSNKYETIREDEYMEKHLVKAETGLLVHRVHLGRVAVVAGAAGANKGLLRKDKKKKK